YRRMMVEDVNQSILISGESGAGKTETTKLLLFHLVSLQGCRSSPSKSGSVVKGLEQKVLLSNTILQAFGNAATVRNQNSSRYGKFVSLYFSRADSKYSLQGCSINVFLLERSRVAHVEKGERNFHIFYQYQNCFPPLRSSSLHAPVGSEDNERDGRSTLESTKEAMRGGGLTEEEVDNVMSTVGLILSLGNILFLPVESKNSTVDRSSSSHALLAAAACLQCSCSELEETLCTRKVRLAGEEVGVDRSEERAGEARDGMCKVIYERLFSWLVRRMNLALLSNARGCSVINVLDIFGFESLEVNGFEQLLINYANERLQSLFNNHMFAFEQETYREEGLTFSLVDFVKVEDRQTGLLTLVDEEIRIPGGSDESLMLKVRTIVASKHEKLTVPKRSSLTFVISHYAGQVCYNGTSFVDKNRDAVGRDVLDFFSRCHFRFFRLLFHEIADVHGGGKQPVADCSRGTSKSLVAKFRKQLTSLEGIMGSTQTHFIRCINSNEKKLPDTFDDVFVLKQIRATGILQAAK
ncbi:hypothetical protein GUITHDRAFT_68130, partial [Guillardia theta CCMP2712]